MEKIKNMFRHYSSVSRRRPTVDPRLRLRRPRGAPGPAPGRARGAAGPPSATQRRSTQPAAAQRQPWLATVNDGDLRRRSLARQPPRTSAGGNAYIRKQIRRIRPYERKSWVDL